MPCIANERKDTVPDLGEPPPCEGCPWCLRCAAGLACERFSFWAYKGVVDRARSRAPSPRVFARLFEPETGEAA